MSRTTARSLEVLTLLFLFAVTIPHHRCSVANMAWDPFASVGRMQTIWAVLARGANCTNVHLARCRELASMLLRSVARTVSSRRRISGPAMELVTGHESFLALSNRGALSILDASFKFARASHLVSGEPWSAFCMEQRAFGGFYVSSAVIGVWACLIFASVRMRPKRGSRSRFVKDVVSWLRKLVLSRSGQG